MKLHQEVAPQQNAKMRPKEMQKCNGAKCKMQKCDRAQCQDVSEQNAKMQQD